MVKRKQEFNKNKGGFVEVVETKWYLRTTMKIVNKDAKLTWRDLWEVDVGQVMREEIVDKDPDRALYGWLPKMASSSRGSIGYLLASSLRFLRTHKLLRKRCVDRGKHNVER